MLFFAFQKYLYLHFFLLQSLVVIEFVISKLCYNKKFLVMINFNYSYFFELIFLICKIF